ncbi:MAG: hypothetical protein PHI70_09955, partial [Proteiniphilum sp.]|nr:hypothetical protein [Proteiniphilum sp.]
MTEKLTIKDLNCGNCPLPYCEDESTDTRFKYCPKIDHYVQMRFDGAYIPYTQSAQDIMKTGCASHPLA